MMNSKNWFEVDKKGLISLQAGKPKHYVLRELIQNCWDENITECITNAEYIKGICYITVKDDNPEWFNRLKDAFTIFRDTSKRRDVTKRGRFNLGEKQAIALCSYAEVKTTKGTIVFDKDGRRYSSARTSKGSIVRLRLKINKEEFKEMLEVVENYLPPKGIKFIVNGRKVEYKKPFKTVYAILTTQFELDRVLRNTKRKTSIEIHMAEKKHLFEMGIPVMKIDCAYSINILQKIPLGIDREAVLPSYLKDVYSVVLNETIDDIEPEKSSEAWIRVGSTDKLTTKNTLSKLMTKRFGEKVVVFSPNDPIANDDALAKGYKLVQGREMSGGEWNRIKEYDLIKSSASVFGMSSATDVKGVEPTTEMKLVAELVLKIAKRVLKKDVKVSFYSSTQAREAASYGGGVLTFNVGRLGKDFFRVPVSAKVINLITHELGHEAGLHTEKKYHELLTKITGELVLIALKEPEFFDLSSNGGIRGE